MVKLFNNKYTKKQILRKANRLGLTLRKYLPKSYKNIYNSIRSNNNYWRIKVLIQYNHRCIFTGSRDVDIHHIIPFHELLNQSYNMLNIDRNNVLTDEETNSLIKTFYNLQNRNDVGVCVNSEIHKLFHKIYTYTRFTKEDWEVFSTDIIEGKYNNFLKRNNLSIDYYTMKK